MRSGQRRAIILASTLLALASVTEGASVALFESPVSAAAVIPRTALVAVRPGTIIADNGSSAYVPVSSLTSGTIAKLAPTSVARVTLEAGPNSTYPKGIWELAIGDARLSSFLDDPSATGEATISSTTDITFTGRGMLPGSRINAFMIIEEAPGIVVRMRLSVGA